MTSSKTISIKDHQLELAEDVLRILGDSDHAYLEAPPASGKTLVMAMICEDLDNGIAYYLAHTLDLVMQAEREIGLYRRQGLIQREVDWRFMTRAAYLSLARSGKFQGSEPHVAFVDECHIGGIAGQRPKVQFPSIVETSDKVVWISATPWDLDESMMGDRAGRTSQLGFDEAFDLGLLNDTDVVRVDCSLDMQIRRTTNGRSLHRAEKDEYVVSGDSADEQHGELDRIVRKIAQRGLRTSDVPTLVHHRHRLMADLYAEQHAGRKAIFWLPSRQHARDCAEYIDASSGVPGTAASILGETKGSLEDAETAAALADWMDPEGRTKVVCVVYRLREGFDHPEAALGFDCSWNPYNHRSAVQKIGRLTRKTEGKPVSLYYYAVDAVTIAGARSREFSNAFMNRLGYHYTRDDVSFMADAFDDMSCVFSAVGETNRWRVLPLLDRLKAGERRLRSTRTPLFDVMSAGGSRTAAPIGFAELMRKASSLAVERLVSEIERGRRPMPGLNSQGEGNMLRRVVSPGSKTFSPRIRERLLRSGHLKARPEKKDTDEVIEGILLSIEAGLTTMRVKDETYRFLWKYVSPVASTYRPEVRRRLIACGAYREGKLKGRTTSTLYRECQEAEAANPSVSIERIGSKMIEDGREAKISTLRGYISRARSMRLSEAEATQANSGEQREP